MADNSKDNPDAACLPLGHMQLHTHSQPRKMIQTKDLIVIIYEANANVRQIFLDERAAPTNDPQPWWVWLPSRTLGRRHTRGGNDEFPRRWMAGCERRPLTDQ